MYIIGYFYVTFCAYYRRAETIGIDIPPTLLFLCHAITIKDHEGKLLPSIPLVTFAQLLV
jgi:hypothetical protein